MDPMGLWKRRFLFKQFLLCQCYRLQARCLIQLCVMVIQNVEGGIISLDPDSATVGTHKDMSHEFMTMSCFRETKRDVWHLLWIEKTRRLKKNGKNYWCCLIMYVKTTDVVYLFDHLWVYNSLDPLNKIEQMGITNPDHPSADRDTYWPTTSIILHSFFGAWSQNLTPNQNPWTLNFPQKKQTDMDFELTWQPSTSMWNEKSSTSSIASIKPPDLMPKTAVLSPGQQTKTTWVQEFNRQAPGGVDRVGGFEPRLVVMVVEGVRLTYRYYKL